MKKENRLKHSDEIAAIVKNRQKVYGKGFIIYYDYNSDIFQVAIAASKKYGDSVERNHAKRVIRELIRPIFKDYKPIRMVVVVKEELKSEQFEDLQVSMKNCFEIIMKRYNNKVEEK